MKNKKQLDKNLTKDKLLDVVVKILIIIIIVHQISAIITSYRFMTINFGNVPQWGVNLVLFVVLLFPILYIIGLIVSLIFIYKKRPWAYFLAIVIVGAILYNAIDSLIKIKASLSSLGIIILILWILLIVLSSMRYYKLKKKK